MAPSLTALLSVTLLLVRIGGAQEDEEPPPAYHTFQSRPDLRPPILNVNISKDAVESGYIFIAPYRTEPNQNTAVIYDTEGNVVWTSFTQTGQNVVYDFTPCQYNASNHLCMVVGQQNRGYSRGYITVFDDTLTQIAQLTSQNGHAGLDQHECTLAYNDTAIIGIVYSPERADLSAQNITEGIGWIQNSLFQKLDVATGELLFEWSAYEHIPLTQSLVPPDSTEVVGTGFSPDSPWDYFHINSIDENADGDYLISARHVNAIYKINGTTGAVIWALGGTDSDFDFTPTSFNFSSQHDARWLESNTTHDIISLFDNASNGFNRTSNTSTGMILSLDHSSTPHPTASLLSSFSQPAGYPLSDSQGNMQVLDKTHWNTSNSFIGWGNVPIVTEHLPTGEIIYRANVEIDPNGMMNYRAYKVPTANLTLSPKDAPALYTYALSDDADDAITVFYMSWNGATEVSSWRILAKPNSCDDEWREIGVAPRRGFETKHRAVGYVAYGMVEALDSQGMGIRNSTLKGVRTFVPGEALRAGCGEEGCMVVAEGYSSVEAGGGGGQQAALGVEQTREACVVTPEELREETERVAAAREERESADADAEAGAGGEEGGGEENAAMKPGVSSAVAGVVAVLASWVLLL